MKPGPQGRAPTGGLADDFPGGGGLELGGFQGMKVGCLGFLVVFS